MSLSKLGLNNPNILQKRKTILGTKTKYRLSRHSPVWHPPYAGNVRDILQRKLLTKLILFYAFTILFISSRLPAKYIPCWRSGEDSPISDMCSSSAFRLS